MDHKLLYTGGFSSNKVYFLKILTFYENPKYRSSRMSGLHVEARLHFLGYRDILICHVITVDNISGHTHIHRHMIAMENIPSHTQTQARNSNKV